MRKLFIISALVCLMSSLSANAYTEANEFHGPVSTEGGELCLNIAKYAALIMHERQYGTPKYVLEANNTKGESAWGPFSAFEPAILNDAYDHPLEPTKELKEKITYDFPAKYYLICMQTISDFETGRLNN